jgi:hypothetical protein
MTFNGIDNQIVELRITNYQYPGNNEGDWDSNWLNIYLNVISNNGNWQTVDASLTTWEVQVLINWFIKLSNDEKPEYLDLSFTEPNLSFELLDNLNKSLKKFRIKFNLESGPKSAKDDNEYFVDCIADSNELKRLAIELETELVKYPERKPV